MYMNDIKSTDERSHEWNEETVLASKDMLLVTSDEGLLMIDVQVGDKVKVMHVPYFDDIPDADQNHPVKGQIVTVKSIKREVTTEGIGPVDSKNERISLVGAWFERTGGSLWMDFDRWEHIGRPDDTSPADAATNPYDDDASFYELKRTIHELQKESTRKDHRIKELIFQMGDEELKTRNALDLISSTLQEEASEREFCSEWDRIVRALNDQLPGTHQLDERSREWKVTWCERYLVTVPRSVTVMASTEEDAIDEAQNTVEWERATDDEVIEGIHAQDPEHYDTDSIEAEEE